MFFIYLLWSFHVFSSARALDPRSPPSSIFLLVLWRQKCQLQIKTENDLLSCGSIDSNSTFCKEGNTKCISSTLIKLPNPITPVCILWFSCTDYFLFSITNITINIKGCSCLSKPQASALHLQLSPLPVFVKPTDNNPSAILFLTDPVVCLHLLWQRFLQKALQFSESIKVRQDISPSEFEPVLQPVGQSYWTQIIPKRLLLLLKWFNKTKMINAWSFSVSGNSKWT